MGIPQLGEVVPHGYRAAKARVGSATTSSGDFDTTESSVFVCEAIVRGLVATLRPAEGKMLKNLLVVDAFYSNPAEICRRALKMPRATPDDLTGLRTSGGFFPAGIKSRLRRAVGTRVTELWAPEGTPYDNGVVFFNPSSGRRKDYAGVHFDSPLSHHVCIIYLSQDVPPDCGTSMFRHRRTGLSGSPTARDRRRLGRTYSQLCEEFDRDSETRSKWIETERVEYRYNRAVIFPARRFHAATQNFGSRVANARMHQLFSFRIAR